MPKIPTYQRQGSIPGKSGQIESPDTSAPISSALSGVAGDLETIARRRLQIQEQDRHFQAVRIGNLVNENALEFEQSQLDLKETESFGSMDRVDEWAKNSSENFTKGLNDRKLTEAIKQHINAKSLQLKDSLSRHETRQRLVVADNTRLQSLETSSKEAFLGSGTLDDNLTQYRKIVLSDPTMGDEAKETAIMSGESAIATARLQGIVNRSPEAADEIIKSGVFNEYLSADKLKEFSEIAAADAKAKEKEAERLAKEQVKQQQKQIGNEFVKKLIDGTLTQNDIARSALEPTGENSKQYWLKQLQDRNKKTTDEWKTDPEVEADLISRLRKDPKSVTEDEILGKIGDGLSTSKGTELLDKREKILFEDPLKTQEAKLAIKRIDDFKKDNLFSSDEKENSRQWAEATSLLDRYILNNPDADPQEYVDQLLEEKKIGWLDGIFGGIQEFVTGGNYAKEDLQRRMAEIEDKAGPEIRKTPPGLEKWMVEARKANPGASDEELEQYYRGKYGNR